MTADAPGGRLGPRPPDRLPAAGRALHEEISGGRRASGPFPLTEPDGTLAGPFNAMVVAPTVGAPLARLGEALRYDTALTPRQRELAILVVATAERSAFERYAHERVGRQVGLTDDELLALRTGAPLALPDPREQVVLDVARALAERGDLDDAEYGRAEAVLGAEQVVELVALVAHYRTVAMLLRVFRAPVPDEA